MASELDRLRAENEVLRRAVLDRDGELAVLKAALSALEAEVERLRRETSRHSGNSGKPPSADTISQRQAQNEARQSRGERRRAAREKAKKLAERPKRKPGKQPGDPGATLRQVDDPDLVISHSSGCCSGCGGDLCDAEVIDVESRQVFDLPRRSLEVTEHRAETRRCGCGRTTKAAFPAQAKATVCYGPLVRAVGVYLVAGQHLPVARASELLAQVCGAPVSTGWLAGLAAEAGGGLRGFIDWLDQPRRARHQQPSRAGPAHGQTIGLPAPAGRSSRSGLRVHHGLPAGLDTSLRGARSWDSRLLSWMAVTVLAATDRSRIWRTATWRISPPAGSRRGRCGATRSTC